MINILFFLVMFVLVPYAGYEIWKDLDRAERKAACEMEKLLTNRVDIRRIK